MCEYFYDRGLHKMDYNMRVAYLCDGKGCKTRSCVENGLCRHTLNIEHAVNFKRCFGSEDYIEKGINRPKYQKIYIVMAVMFIFGVLIGKGVL